uniref:Secreted protein n=1 Tax=Setaria viridis TaxID=4556 RepID=A0A4U6VNK0_SETVI|nr:hypothetical protein SEVIR_2G098550v2 [Setaria viridis]
MMFHEFSFFSLFLALTRIYSYSHHTQNLLFHAAIINTTHCEGWQHQHMHYQTKWHTCHFQNDIHIHHGPYVKC